MSEDYGDGLYGDGIYEGPTPLGIITGRPSPPRVVQQVTGAPGNVTNFSTDAVTTYSNSTLLLLIGRGSGTTGNVDTVTDPAGNTWQVATRGGQGGSANTHCEVWYTNQDVAGLTGQTISVTTSGSQLTVYNMVEVAGLDRYTAVEAVSPDPSGAAATTTHSTPSVTTAWLKDWIVTVVNHAYNATADTFTSSGGTQFTSVVSGTDFRMSAGYYPTTAAGSYDGDWTLPASTAAGLITVAFRASRPFSVLVDWDRDGDFTTTGDDVSELVRSRVGMSFDYGRDQSTALAPSVAGRGQFTLDNSDRTFSPRNTGSPLYGKTKPARPVLVTRTVGTRLYTLFQGHTDDNPINPDLDAKSVTLTLVDGLADLRGQTITTGLHAGIRTGDAINKVLDACGWPDELRDLDPGATIIPFWWENGTDALDAITKLVQSEGTPALVTQGADGSIMFLDRHHRLLNTASLVSQATWRADLSASQAYLLKPFAYDEAWRNIVNNAVIDVDVRAPQPLQSVYSGDGKLVLAANEVKLLTVSSSDPFFNAQTPVEDTDYTVITGGVTVELIKDAGITSAIKLTAGSSGAQVESLTLRAQPITVSNTIQVSAVDTQSAADFGVRSLPHDLPWCDPETAQAVVDLIVGQRSDPLPILTVTLLASSHFSDAMLDSILARNLSDRVTIYEDETDLNGVDFYIESISHTLTTEMDHQVTFGLEMAPIPISPVFRFNTSGQGFNQGLFGNGVDEPDNVFQFDATVSGHRFDEGVFAN